MRFDIEALMDSLKLNQNHTNRPTGMDFGSLRTELEVP